MNKDKLKNLMKYKQDIENKLSSPLPNKHLHRENSYKQLLKNELSMVINNINKLKGLA